MQNSKKCHDSLRSQERYFRAKTDGSLLRLFALRKWCDISQKFRFRKGELPFILFPVAFKQKVI